MDQEKPIKKAETILSKIQSKIQFSFDGFRKDSKKVSRKLCIKYFHKLMIRFSNKDFLHLKCLRNSKPCCKTLVLHLEKKTHFCNYYPIRINHIKCMKLEIGAKAIIDMKNKFWASIAPQSTFFDYLSSDVGNLIKAFSKNHVFKYRNIVHFSFPIINARFD